jgi:phosphoglycerate dehydrogenase-like enzyme/CMP-N-acetylneuraminic acid synthetase
MIGNKRVLVNILARAGSTSVKDKNIAIVGGNPVIWYSVTEAMKSKYACDICVSTDSRKYADIVEAIGLKVPFLRDAQYAQKTSTAADASKWTTSKFEEYSGKRYDYIVDFMNSNPCKTVEDLDNCIKMLHENDNADTVVAVNRVWDGHPDRIKQIVDGELQDWPGTSEILESLRQDLVPPAYIRSGSVYAMKRHVLMVEGNRRGKVSLAYIMNDDNVCNIDEPSDLYKAKIMLDIRNEEKVREGGDLQNQDVKILAVSKCEDLDSVKTALESIGAVEYKPDLTQEELKANIHNYEVVIMPTHLKIDSMDWDQESNIKIVACPSVGNEHLDIEFLRSKGINVIGLSGEQELTKTIYSPAELAFTHMINITRNFSDALTRSQNGAWSTSGLIGNELDGKTIGIIGYGSVGANMKKYCAAFGMNILAHDPYKIISDPSVKQVKGLEELLENSDIVSLHASYDGKNKGMIDYECFKRMKRKCIFINTARGELVVEKDMIKALKNGVIFAAGVDVLENESLDKGEDIRSRLKEYADVNNLHITPHLGGSTYEARNKRLMHITKMISQIISGVK